MQTGVRCCCTVQYSKSMQDATCANRAMCATERLSAWTSCAATSVGRGSSARSLIASTCPAHNPHWPHRRKLGTAVPIWSRSDSSKRPPDPICRCGPMRYCVVGLKVGPTRPKSAAHRLRGRMAHRTARPLSSPARRPLTFPSQTANGTETAAFSQREPSGYSGYSQYAAAGAMAGRGAGSACQKPPSAHEPCFEPAGSGSHSRSCMSGALSHACVPYSLAICRSKARASPLACRAKAARRCMRSTCSRRASERLGR